MTKRFISLIKVAAALSVLACSGDVSGPAEKNVSGLWTYSATNMVDGHGLSCNVLGATLSLTQTGASFSGTYSGGRMSCYGDGGFSYEPSTSLEGTVVSGTVSGSTVNFSFDTPDYFNTGTLNGRSLSGTATMSVVSGSSRITMTGVFAAARQ
ncbi:MAG TPA: hypothetical protein VFD22_06220 [Gemmatimonadaceae bacterium]|nr:hypothetical protein [Gemmatimonadaceae bacterium]